MPRPQMKAATPMYGFDEAYPSSRKVYRESGRVRVPFREVELSGGEPAVGLYDTSGPQGFTTAEGLPELRKPWIAGRGGVREVSRSIPIDTGKMSPALAARARTALRGDGCVTQLHYARQGVVTPEMEFIALREGLDPEFVRSEI